MVEIVRDTRLRDMCRELPCTMPGCGYAGPDAGVTWAHSNWSEHGKAMARKASDVYVAALCWRCHRELDQGHRWGAEEKRQRWVQAHRRTVRLAVTRGLWPPGIRKPDVA